MNIILCGMTMCGKTTIGKRLSERLVWGFIDIDRLIESRYHLKTGVKATCHEICMGEGEKVFRAYEDETIASLKATQKSIVAIGGGSLVNPANQEVLKKTGTLIYLKTAANILLERMKTRGIPGYIDPKRPEESFMDALKKRIPLYESVTDHIIDTEYKTLEEIVIEIENITQKNLKVKNGK